MITSCRKPPQKLERSCTEQNFKFSWIEKFNGKRFYNKLNIGYLTSTSPSLSSTFWWQPKRFKSYTLFKQSFRFFHNKALSFSTQSFFWGTVMNRDKRFVRVWKCTKTESMCTALVHCALQGDFDAILFCPSYWFHVSTRSGIKR